MSKGTARTRFQIVSSGERMVMGRSTSSFGPLASRTCAAHVDELLAAAYLVIGGFARGANVHTCAVGSGTTITDVLSADLVLVVLSAKFVTVRVESIISLTNRQECFQLERLLASLAT